jgi:hypothetical protein
MQETLKQPYAWSTEEFNVNGELVWSSITQFRPKELSWIRDFLIRNITLRSLLSTKMKQMLKKLQELKAIVNLRNVLLTLIMAFNMGCVSLATSVAIQVVGEQYLISQNKPIIRCNLINVAQGKMFILVGL